MILEWLMNKKHCNLPVQFQCIPGTNKSIALIWMFTLFLLANKATLVPLLFVYSHSPFMALRLGQEKSPVILPRGGLWSEPGFAPSSVLWLCPFFLVCEAAIPAVIINAVNWDCSCVSREDVLWNSWPYFWIDIQYLGLQSKQIFSIQLGGL